jgi:hypothetical protein
LWGHNAVTLSECESEEEEDDKTDDEYKEDNEEEEEEDAAAAAAAAENEGACIAVRRSKRLQEHNKKHENKPKRRKGKKKHKKDSTVKVTKSKRRRRSKSCKKRKSAAAVPSLYSESASIAAESIPHHQQPIHTAEPHHEALEFGVFTRFTSYCLGHQIPAALTTNIPPYRKQIQVPRQQRYQPARRNIVSWWNKMYPNT